MSEGFQPHYDWEMLSDDMLNDLHQTSIEYCKTRDTFLIEKTRESAIEFLKAIEKASKTQSEIMNALYVEPALVHVAGSKMEEEIDGEECVVQRCKRCKTILQFWSEKATYLTSIGPVGMDESEVQWWDEDSLLAKRFYNGIAKIEIIENRELSKHEKLCFDFSEIN